MLTVSVTVGCSVSTGGVAVHRARMCTGMPAAAHRWCLLPPTGETAKFVEFPDKLDLPDICRCRFRAPPDHHYGVVL